MALISPNIDPGSPSESRNCELDERFLDDSCEGCDGNNRTLQPSLPEVQTQNN